MNYKEWEEYIKQLALEQAKAKSQNQGGLDRVKEVTGKIGTYGDKISKAGNLVSTINNPKMQSLGTNMAKVGDSMINGANTVSNALNLSNIGGATAGATAGGAAAGGGAAGAAALGGPIGLLVGLGTAAIQGTNRKRAAQSGQKLLEDTMNESMQMANSVDSEPVMLQQPTYSNPVFENALNNSYAGITGGAAPLQGQVSQQAQIPIPTPAPQQEPQAVPQQQSLIGKLASGLGDFSRGYQENLNNAFNPSNLTADKFTETISPNNDILAKYQAQLTNQGYAPEVVSAVADKKNSGFKNIDEWIKNNPTAFAQTKTYDKGNMGRLGELAGTIARFSQKPGVQALIAGGLSTALTGDPMYGLGQAYKFGNQRAKNNIYEQALQKYGIEAKPGFFGNVGPQDLNAIGNLYYKDLLDIYRNKQLEEQKAYHKDTIEQKTRANDIKERQGNEKNKIAAMKANNKSSGGTTQKANKAAYTKNLNKDLADYSKLTPEQKSKVRPKMIEAYGKDFLSQESKFAPKNMKKYTAPGL